MGIDLWIPHYENLYGHLSGNEVDFVTSKLSECDDGSYFLNDKNLTYIEKEMSNEEKEEFEDLLNALKDGLKKEDGSLTVEIF